MSQKVSAGLLPYRLVNNSLEVLLAHYGGPLWARKDLGAWTVVKGEIGEGEDLFGCAKREFAEETGIDLSGVSEFIPLGEITQRGGKTVHAWAFLGNVPDNFVLKSGTFEMEWPPRSGKVQSFPEIDKAEWFSLDFARQKINPAQVAFLDRLSQYLSSR